MTAQKLTPAERLDLLVQLYLRPCEVTRILGLPNSTVHDAIKRSGIKKYGSFGYLTDDIIAAFELSGAIKRWRSFG